MQIVAYVLQHASPIIPRIQCEHHMDMTDSVSC